MGPRFFPIAGLLLLIQGVVVATFVPRVRLWHVAAGGALVAAFFPVWMMALVIDMRPPEVGFRSSLLDVAIFVPFALAMSMLAQWVSKRWRAASSIGVVLIGAPLLALWLGITDLCRYPRWEGSDWIGGTQQCEYWGSSPEFHLLGAAIFFVIQGGVLAIINPSRRVFAIVPFVVSTVVLGTLLIDPFFTDRNPDLRAVGALQFAVVAIASVLACVMAALGHVLVRRSQARPRGGC